MSNLPSLRERYLTNTGAVLNAGKLYTYIANTTTDKATYTTSARDVAHSNPITLDAYGMPPSSIHLIPGEGYKFVLKDSAGNTIWTEDNVYGATIDDTDLSAHLYETAENPNRYGALGAGSVDESTYVQQAIDAAVDDNREGVVDLMGRYYRCDSALTLHSGLTLRNGTLDFSSCTADAYIVAAGTRGNAIPLLTNAVSGVEQCELTSGTGFASNDLVYIYDNGGTNNGEIRRISGVSGSTIYILGTLDDSYTTALSGAVEELTPATDIRLRDLVVIANPQAASGIGDVIKLDTTKDALIENVRVRGWKGHGIEIRQSVGSKIINCTFEQTQSNIGDGAINFCDASRESLVSGCVVSRSEYGIVIGYEQSAGGKGGVSRHITVSNCHLVSAGTDAFGMVTVGLHSQYVTVSDCHLQATDTTISTSTTILCAAGVWVSGYDTSVHGCTFVGLDNSSTSGCVRVDFSQNRSTATAGRSLTIRDNIIRSAGSPAKMVYGVLDHPTISVIIDGNRDDAATNTDHGGVYLTISSSATSDVDNVIITNNIFRGTGLNGGIQLLSGAAYNFEQVTISNNTCPTIRVDGYSTGPVATDNIVITGNNLLWQPAAADEAIQVTVAKRVTISGNSINTNNMLAGILVSNESAPTIEGIFTVSGNTLLSTSSDANASFIRIGDAYQATVNCNNISGPGLYGIYGLAVGKTLSGFVVVGNEIEGALTGAGIRVRGTDATYKVTRAVVTGNNVLTNTRSIELNGDIDGGLISGNSCEGNDSYPQIYLNARATGTINDVAITGNVIVDGTYALEVVNGATSANNTWSGNLFKSQATGIVSGIIGGWNQAIITSAALTNTTIVGTAAGDLGHAAGVTIIAAVPGKIIVPLGIVINYTFATAAYTGGGLISAIYVGGNACTSSVNMAGSFGAGASNTNVLHPTASAAPANTAVALVCAAGITDPGTAAGTAVVTSYYRLVDADT